MITTAATAIRSETWTPAPLIPAGQACVAIALAGFGVQQFLWGDFVPGRAAAWPEGVPGRLAWAYLSGAGFMATGVLTAMAMVDRTAGYARAARAALIVSAGVILLWAGLRHLPAVAADTQLGGDWTRLGKALMLFGGALAAAASLPSAPAASSLWHRLLNTTHAFVLTGRACLGSFFVLCGIQHFIWTDFVASLVPAWIPGAVFWSYFTGVALIAGGAGMMFPPTATLAGLLSALMVFTWVVILHVPRAIAAAEAGSSRNEWTAVVEALAVSGIALLVTMRASARRATG